MPLIKLPDKRQKAYYEAQKNYIEGKRTIAQQGGTSSGKTFANLQLLSIIAYSNNVLISIVSETLPHLKKGVLRDFKKIIEDWKLEFDCNKSDLIFTSKLSGGQVEFFSVDDPQKARGPRRDILYINECNNVPFETYEQLAIRTKKTVFLDYNPVSEFWIHTSGLLNESNSAFIITTYKDNQYLDKNIIEAIEKKKSNRNWWRVYGEGLVGNLEGVVFDNWQQIDNVPKEAELLGVGLDFGFSNDPTAGVKLYRFNGELIVDEFIYSTGLLNSDIVNLLPNGELIVADSAEPKSIEEIRRKGKQIIGCVKGSDSINSTIQTLKDYQIKVTKNSTNLIKEFRNYTWMVDKNGNKLNRPIDDYNHAIDALRYIAGHALMKEKRKPMKIIS